MSAGDETMDEAIKVEETNDNIDNVDASEQTIATKSVEILQPNATLYVSNIDWAIKKNILRRALLVLFGRHGKVLEVVTLRREGLRGQAWIVFEETSSAIAAQREENGFTFFGKPLKVDYAREKSDRIAKQDGTYVPKDRRLKRARAAAASNAEKSKHPTNTNANESHSVSHSNPSSLIQDSNNSMNSNSSTEPRSSGDQGGQSHDAMQGGDNNGSNAQETNKMEESPPSNILFAEDLPSECNEMMLAMLFRQYAGYKEVRIPRAGLAFIEFDDEPQATLALRGLNGFTITSADTLNLKYSK